MKMETNVANTTSWLESIKDIKIKAYIESYMTTLSVRENQIPSADLYTALEQIGVPFNLPHYNIEEEFIDWDILSDEALRNLEIGIE